MAKAFQTVAGEDRRVKLSVGREDRDLLPRLAVQEDLQPRVPVGLVDLDDHPGILQPDCLGIGPDDARRERDSGGQRDEHPPYAS